MREIILLFSEIVTSVAKQSDHFNEIKKLINYIYQSPNWSILRLDETTNQLFFTVIEGEASKLLKPIPIKVGDGICDQVALTGIYKIIDEFDEKPDITKSIDNVTHFKTKNIIAVPIKNNNKIMGVLELINVENPAKFKLAIHLNLLQTIANLVGLIFSLSNTHQGLIFSSERDILTGLLNRTFFNNYTKKNDPINKSEHIENHLLVMIDVDNFKGVNDKYGHLTGDHVLKDTAKLLTKKFRKDDLIIRYGGDEFIIIIKLKNNDKEHNIKKTTENKLNAISRAMPYSCSLSYGISCGEKLNFHTLLDEADKLMYKNKRQNNILCRE